MRTSPLSAEISLKPKFNGWLQRDALPSYYNLLALNRVRYGVEYIHDMDE